MKLRLMVLLQKLLLPMVRLAVRVAPETFFPVPRFARPTGRHPVGVRDIQCGDNSRKLMARIWYPAGSVAGVERRAYLTKEEYPVMEAGLMQALGYNRSMVRRLAAIQTWSHEGAAPLAAAEDELPLVLFSHGFGCLVASNTQLCEELASHGYLVVSLAHPGSTAALCYPDGSGAVLAEDCLRTIARPGLLDLAMGVLGAGSPEERKRATLGWSSDAGMKALSDTWVSDSRRCLDDLSAGACEPPCEDLVAVANFSRVGACGMSFGGSVSATLAQEDGRVAAVINLDGGQVDTALVNAPCRVPLLMLHSNALPMAEQGGFNDFHYEPHHVAGQTPGVERALVDGSAHMDFTDSTVFRGRLLRWLSGLGTISGERMVALTSAACVAFLDRHLRGRGADQHGGVLPGLSRQWQEIWLLDLSRVRNASRSLSDL
ncbi:MAG: hypothetical protein RJQ10_03630 [Haliea sp.]|uniref:alpha/beta hydrolase family protein n=1 Tax=Haliea sp. TaxID=1932666 RepID=UPI0032EABB33